MRADSDTLAEILESVVQAGGRLLRVDRAPRAGSAGARASSALRLSFDVGIVTLRPCGTEGDLEVGRLADAGSPVFASANEEDPWWAVMGCPLTRVQVRAAGGVRLQFRGDRDNPRHFVLYPRAEGIEIFSER